MLDQAKPGWNKGNEAGEYLAELRATALASRGDWDDEAQYNRLAGDAALYGLLEMAFNDNVTVAGTGLLDLPAEAIVVRDLGGKILFWNSGAESLFGWMRDEVVGKNLHQIS